jgi:hypothetical protein
MVLWLNLIKSLIQEVYLFDGWEYSNGGAAEFAHALSIQCRFIEGRDDRILIFDHKKREVDIVEAAYRLVEAIKDLDRRGHATGSLREAMSQVTNIAAFECDYLTSRDESVYHFGHVYNRFSGAPIVKAAHAIGVN